jgi:hypothetical protein
MTTRSTIVKLLENACKEALWNSEEAVDVLTDFLEHLVIGGAFDSVDFSNFLDAKLQEQKEVERIAKEESEAGDEELAAMMIVCPLCGAAGSPDAIHRGECHNQLSQG